MDEDTLLKPIVITEAVELIKPNKVAVEASRLFRRVVKFAVEVSTFGSDPTVIL